MIVQLQVKTPLEINLIFIFSIEKSSGGYLKTHQQPIHRTFDTSVLGLNIFLIISTINLSLK